MATSARRIALAAFIGNAVLAGGNGVCIRVSHRELAPLWGASLRFSLAAVLLFAVVAAMRLSLPRGRALAGAVAYGLLTIGAGFALIYYGLVRVQAGLAQMIMALVPLATLLLAVLERQERLRVAALLGTMLALGGVALMSRAPLSESVPLTSLLALLGGVLCLAQGGVLVRQVPPVHPVTMNAVGMAAGSLLLLVASVIAGEPRAFPRSVDTWLAISYVVPVGSVLVFVLYLVVLGHWSASRASYSFVVTPFVTLVLSAWIDGEPITIELLIGGVLVLTGVYIGALRAGEGVSSDDGPRDRPH